MSIVENLKSLPGQKIKEKNFVNHFMTFRQQRSDKIPDADFQAVMGQLLSVAYRKKLKKGCELDDFILSCKQKLDDKINDADFSALLDDMYFRDDARGLFQISPDFLIFLDGKNSAGSTKHVGQVLSDLLLAREQVYPEQASDVNFLERELISELRSSLVDYTPTSNAQPYLPFMAELFQKDFSFLCSHPDYMLQNLRAFIGLFNFLYSAQLALNINDWVSVPTSKPLFFILDTERSSAERKQVRDACPWLKEKVADLFPILSVLEYLNDASSKSAQRFPLWQYFQHINGLPEIEQKNVVISLIEFLNSYRDERKLPALNEPEINHKSVFEQLVKTAKEVFSKPRSGQQTVNSRVVNAFENEVARHFIQNRRRGGLVMILNQDYLLLLTNLAIGSEPKMQFQKLMAAFNSRGVWFDQQSQQALIEFFERVGNLERMSDSGDAVYVRKTI